MGGYMQFEGVGELPAKAYVTDSMTAIRINARHFNLTIKLLHQFYGQQLFETVVLILGEKQSEMRSGPFQKHFSLNIILFIS
jgi:hypothetical protein